VVTDQRRRCRNLPVRVREPRDALATPVGAEPAGWTLGHAAILTHQAPSQTTPSPTQQADAVHHDAPPLVANPLLRLAAG
jgi:hypothetical protein